MASPDKRLVDAIENLGIAKVRRCDVIEEQGQIQMLCRVTHVDPRKHINAARAWLAVVESILVEEERMVEELEDEYQAAVEEHEEDTEQPVLGVPSWNVHICKHYILVNGKLCYAWNFTLQANSDLRSAVSDICRLLTIMSRHVDVYLNEPVSQTVTSVPTSHSVVMQQQPAPPRRQSESVPGQGTGGILDALGNVVEMPLIGVTATRNAPQARILTPGVRGMGRKSGVSSKGAHTI